MLRKTYGLLGALAVLSASIAVLHPAAPAQAEAAPLACRTSDSQVRDFEPSLRAAALSAFQWALTDGDFSFYGAAEGVTDAGWRFHSQSNLARLYGDAGWRLGETELHLVVSGAATSLGVVGPTPIGLIQRNAKSVFTFPQTTRNTIGSVALNAKNQAGRSLAVRRVSLYARASAASC